MPSIIFISEIQDPEKLGSSTQILTKNIIEGFYLNKFNVTFIAIIDADCNSVNVINNYLNITNKIIIINSKVNLRLTNGKYKKLLKLMYHTLFRTKYNEIGNLDIGKDPIIISHSPSVESIFVSLDLLSKNNRIRYIQYWSDPIAISGIYPEQLNYKRYAHYLIEKILLSKSSEIVYATKTLCLFQKKIYPFHSHKMRYVDVGYINQIPQNKKKQAINPKIIYAGSYKSNIRNIKPLYKAMSLLKNINLLICGDSDISLDSTESIEVVKKRFSQNEILKIENDADILVSILNSSCIQIPGKVFYHTNKNIVLLVVVDGIYGEAIKEYLSEFKRFEFCENNIESIKKAITRIKSTNFHVNLSSINLLSPQVISKKIIDPL